MLTVKQENFCQKFVETGNASEAYRESYNATRMKPETINRKAKELLDNGKITARVEQLKSEHRKRHDVNVDSLMIELEEARKLAQQIDQPAAMVSATMGKAKIVGLDKLIHEHTGKNGAPIEVANLTMEQYKQARREMLEEDDC